MVILAIVQNNSLNAQRMRQTRLCYFVLLEHGCQEHSRKARENMVCPVRTTFGQTTFLGAYVVQHYGTDGGRIT